MPPGGSMDAVAVAARPARKPFGDLVFVPANSAGTDDDRFGERAGPHQPVDRRFGESAARLNFGAGQQVRHGPERTSRFLAAHPHSFYRFA